MLKKAAAKSRKEVAKLRKAFKAGLKPPPIPDGIVGFLLQNSPSAKVDFTTKYPGTFKLKQVIIKKINVYRVMDLSNLMYIIIYSWSWICICYIILILGVGRPHVVLVASCANPILK
jgi:hypothetical protein